MKRLFFALTFDQSMTGRLTSVMDQIKPWVNQARWTRPQNLHVTLAFLGACGTQTLGQLAGLLPPLAAATHAFSVQLAGWGLGGRHQDLLWVGLADQPALTDLVNRLRKALSAAGLPVDQRPYWPHVTLARQVDWLGDKPQPRIDQTPCLMTRMCLMESLGHKEQLLYQPLMCQTLPLDERTS